jgi:hypothetical protein
MICNRHSAYGPGVMTSELNVLADQMVLAHLKAGLAPKIPVPGHDLLMGTEPIDSSPEDDMGDCLECWQTVALYLTGWLSSVLGRTDGADKAIRYIEKDINWEPPDEDEDEP